MFHLPTRQFLLTLLLLLACVAAAQTPIHRRFTTADGLPSNTIYSIIQDHQGYLWFATDVGVSRFDGGTFVNYNVADGLPDTDIINLYEDRQQRIWFMGFNGRLGYLREGVFHNMANTPDLAKYSCVSGCQTMTEDRHGRIWVGGVRAEVLQLDLDGDADGYWTWGDAPVSISLDDHGEVLVVHGGRIKGYADGVWTTTDSLPDALHNVFSRPATPEGTGMLVLSRRGVHEVRDRRWGLLLAHAGMDAEKHQRCWIDAEGVIWVRRWRQGVERIILAHDHAIAQHELLFPDISINYVFTDRDRNVWFATPRNGVMLCAPGQERTANFRDLANRWDEALLDLHRDHEGTIWAGGVSGHIMALRKDVVTGGLGWDSDRGMGRVLSLAEGTSGHIYAGTDNGTFLIRPGATRFQPMRSDRDQPIKWAVKDLATAPDGTLWIASFGLFRVRPGTPPDLLEFVPTRLGTTRIQRLACDLQGGLWLSGLHKLHYFVDDSIMDVPVPGLSAPSVITDLRVDHQGVLFVATTDHGVLRFNGSEWLPPLNKASGLIADRVDRIHCQHDTLLLCTPRGLQIIIGEGSPQQRSWTMGSMSALGTDQINDAWVGGGQLFVTSNLGLCRMPFPPPEVEPFEPKLVLEHVTVDGRSTPPTGSGLQVRSGQRVGLVVRPLDFIAAQLAEFSYRTEEGATWKQATSGQLEFAGLEKGVHHIGLRVRRPGGAWSAPVSLRLEVVPPWWDQATVKIGAVLLLLLAVIGAVRAATMRRYANALERERQRTALNEERRRISADVHDDLGAELSNVLMFARTASRRATDEASRATMARVTESIAGSIARIDEIIWSLDPQRDTLQATIDFIEQQAGDYLEAHEIGFRAAVDLPRTDRVLSANTRREIWLVVREALRNVVKHAQATTVSISWAFTGEEVVLGLEDDGVGPAGADRPDRYGMGNMLARAERLGARLTISTGALGGTRIELRVPAHLMELPVPTPGAGSRSFDRP